MSENIVRDQFTQALFYLLDEAFVQHHGIFLDKGTSLFETLEGINAAQASIPVGGRCATLAAQVKHVRFYMDVLEDYMLGHAPENVDWGEIWRTTREVSPEEWDGLRQQLRDAYQRVLGSMKAIQTWEGKFEIGGALAILTHTAYHLGEIRQALCTLQE